MGESEQFYILNGLFRLSEKELLEVEDQGWRGSKPGRGMMTWIMIRICLNTSWGHPLLILDSSDY